MNKKEIISLLPANYRVTDYPLKNDLLKIQHIYNNKIVSNYFIDYDSNLDDFDINSYQEQYLSNDFFSSNSNLQWNYYLIFLRENFSSDFKKRIENNLDYARKFVFNKNELQDYLHYEESKSDQENDIVIRWKEKLLSTNLQEVFSDEHYNKAVPRFIEGKPKNLKELKPLDLNPNQKEDFVLNSLKELQLKDEYRKYPRQRNYNLGKVNMIFGPNGVGKTSLLESIELVITGNHGRSQNTITSTNQVSATYESNDGTYKDSYDNSLSKYKARDYYWYNKPFGKFNELHHSFNRYNFYNSDTAYKLSIRPDSADITSYLSSIALGAEYGALRIRVDGFLKRLQEDQRVFNKQLEKEKNARAGAQSKLESLKDIIDPEKAFKSFLDASKKLKWKGNLPSDIDDETLFFENDYKTLITYLDSLVHSEVTSEKAAFEKLRELKAMEKNIAKKEKDKEGNIVLSKAVDKDLKAINERKLLINRALKYLREPRSFIIQNIEGDLNELKNRIDFFNNIKSQLEKIDIKKIISAESTISLLKTNLKNRQAEKLTVKEKFVEQLEILKKTLDRINSIIADIKYYGKEYVSQAENIDSCPLCETPHSKSQLLKKIERKNDGNKSAKDIEVFNKNISTLEDEIKRTSEELEILEKYELIIKNLIPDYEKKTLSELFTIYTNLVNQNTEDTILQRELQVLFFSLKDKFSKSEYDEIKAEFNNKNKNLVFKSDSLKNFEKEAKNLKKKEEDLVNNRAVYNDKIDSLNEEIKGLLKEDFDFKNYKNQIEFKIAEYQSSVDYFKEIKQFIALKSTDFIIWILRFVLCHPFRCYSARHFGLICATFGLERNPFRFVLCQ